MTAPDDKTYDDKTYDDAVLEDALERLAQTPVLLVASDYDGTLSPIVDDPTKATPVHEAVVALRLLAELPNTHVAVVSGRALGNLSQMLGAPEDIHLVGSHGSEFEADFATRLPHEAVVLRERVRDELSRIASRGNGYTLEEKPASIAFHYRNAPEAEAREFLREVLDGAAAWEGVYTKHGKAVVELGVVASDKGRALDVLRHRVGASAALFAGDDITDEDAFARLAGDDLALKVGDGASRASYRVRDPLEVARVLAQLYERRDAWLSHREAAPIEQHSLLSDQRSLALVAPDASIDWFCSPRLDSPALFAALLGGTPAGRFRVCPADGTAPLGQRYMPNSLVLETTFPGFTVTDFLDCSGERARRRAGRSELVRLIEGRGRVRIEFAPRLDFGRVETRLEEKPGGLLVDGALDPVVLRAPDMRWEIREEGHHHTAVAEVDLMPDQPLELVLVYGVANLTSTRTAVQRREHTENFWSHWAECLELPATATEDVRRSALLLKGLCYGPSGAIAAAATTSLPERIGGVRNWDYRYCWLRDGAMAATSLARLGSLAEGMQFLDWVLGLVETRETPERLHPLYTVTGGAVAPDATIEELPGYRGSRPVRIGNSAAQQIQLDVFGPVVDLIAHLREHDAPLSAEHWRLVESMVRAVELRWHEPDHGIWEIRRPRRHHVHSRVMCWLTVDRALRLADEMLARDLPHWRALRDRIAEDVLTHGYKEEVGAFTAAYDDVDLDAAALWVGLSGLLPPEDPRFRSTVDAVERGLRHGPVVHRYLADDGLPGAEGGFLLCASWLVESLILIGEETRACALFEEIRGLAGPTGLMSEEHDADADVALGNVPQAYSHIGLIDNAVLLDTLRRNTG